MTNQVKVSTIWNDALKVGDTITANEFRSLCKQLGVSAEHASTGQIQLFFTYRLRQSQARETKLPSGTEAYEKLADMVPRNVSDRKSRKDLVAISTPALPTTQPMDELSVGRSIIRLIGQLEQKIKSQNEELKQCLEEKTQLNRQCVELKERLCQLNQQKSSKTINLHALQELVGGSK